MKKTLFLSAILAIVSSQVAMAQNNIDTSIFPKPKQGNTQHVFKIPPHAQENQYLIEVVASKNILSDCNKVMISADLDQEDLSGWGYPYFEIDDVSLPASTMMACPNTTKTEQRVELNLGKDSLVRYNSKLPLVIYAPKDVQVGYRVWQTDGTVHAHIKP